MSFATPGISNINARPPTPPKSRDLDKDIQATLDFLDVDYSLDKPCSNFANPVSGINTPPQSSPNSNARLSRKKKVEFKSSTVRTIQHDGASPKKETLIHRPLPQTRQVRPARSILKNNICSTPTTEELSSPATSYFTSPQERIRSPKMLASVLQELASSDESTRLDGYMTLSNALRAHDSFPTQGNLRQEIPRLMQHVLRDLKCDYTAPTGQNTIIQALGLFYGLLVIPEYASKIGNDAHTTLIDRALDIFKQESVNKAIANKYLALFAHPNFRIKGTSHGKLETLLKQLYDIEQRIPGNNVVVVRLAVYQRLINQVPQIMLARTVDWIEHVFKGCLINHDEICKKAIQCGVSAAQTLGNNYSAGKAVSDLFAVETEQGVSFGRHLMTELTKMAGNRKQSPLVPQIWSVITLFFRSKKRPISHLAIFKDLLKVIQMSLNALDPLTRNSALAAWNKLVFVVDLNYAQIAPPDAILARLKTPFAATIGTTPQNPKGVVDARKAVRHGYANLLYYALQPGQSHDRLDYYWDLYVSDMIPTMLRNEGTEGRFARDILKALFHGSAPAFEKDRVLQSIPISPDEICRLDCHWLRSRLDKILRPLESYFGSLLCTEPSASLNEGPLWDALIVGVRDACSQEVRASQDTREALAHLMNFFKKLWTNSSKWVQNSSPQIFVTQLGRMLQSTMATIGLPRFLEDNITIDMSSRATAAPTPSNRSSKHSATLQSAFIFMWRMLVTESSVRQQHESLLQILSSLLDTVLRKQSPLEKLRLIRSCATALPINTETTVDQDLTALVLQALLERLTAVLVDTDALAALRSSVSQVAKTCTSVLCHSLFLLGSLESGGKWLAAFDSCSDFFAEIGGPGAVALGLIEPLTAHVFGSEIEHSATALVSLATRLLCKSITQPSRKQLEQSMKLLQGNSLDSMKRQAHSEKVQEVLKLANLACKQSMTDAHLVNTAGPKFLMALKSCLDGIPDRVLLQSLSAIPNLGLVLQDPNAFLADIGPVADLWNSVLSSIEHLPANAETLAAVDELLIAAFTTQHRAVANLTITFWNKTFGECEDLQYPSSLGSVVRQVSTLIDLQLASTPCSDEDDRVVSLPAFSKDIVLSQDETISMPPPRKTPTPARIAQSDHAIRHVPEHRTPPRAKASAHASVTPKSVAMPPPKLRHEDSQIEFVSVDNLPSELSSDVSQTEHQREICFRQQEEANALFPQVSSSPCPPSTIKNAVKDRIAHVNEQHAIGARPKTPEIDNDDQCMNDAYLGSSPSQRSAQRSAQRARSRSSEGLHVQPLVFDRVSAEIIDEVPSSPPEMSEDLAATSDRDLLFAGVAPTSEFILIAGEDALVSNDELTSKEGDMINASVTPTRKSADPLTVPGSNAPAGAFVAGGEGGQANHNVAGEGEMKDADPHEAGIIATFEQVTDSNPVVGVDLAPATDRNLVTIAGAVIAETAESDIEEVPSSVQDPEPIVEIDGTRIEDSFEGGSDAGTTLVAVEDGHAKATKPATPAESRKRKSPEMQAVLDSQPSKKQKRSPINKFMSWLGGKAHEQDDMQDCIVVATQPEPSQPSLTDKRPSPALSVPGGSSQSSVKRGRGRPRKQPLQTLERHSSRTTDRIRMRKSSMVRKNDYQPSITSSQKAKRTATRGNRATSSRTNQSPGVTVVISPKSLDGYVSAEVGSSPASVLETRYALKDEEVNEAEEDGEEGDDEDDLVSPENQLRQEAAAAAAAAAKALLKKHRTWSLEESEECEDEEEEEADEEDGEEPVNLTPRSIIGRLKGLLGDVRKMGKKLVLGAQEEREVNGMLFALGGDLHAAALRRAGG